MSPFHGLGNQGSVIQRDLPKERRPQDPDASQDEGLHPARAWALGLPGLFAGAFPISSPMKSNTVLGVSPRGAHISAHGALWGH